VRLEASCYVALGSEGRRGQAGVRAAEKARTTSALVNSEGKRTSLGEPSGRYFSQSHQAHGKRIYGWTEGSALAVNANRLACSSRGVQRFSATEGVSDRSRSTQRKQEGERRSFGMFSTKLN
jgi:hypothetical protein